MTGKLENLHPDLLHILSTLEEKLGMSLTITSGKRDEAHNAKVGGVKGSEHTYDPAEGADVACTTSPLRFQMVEALLNMGVRRIGIGQTFVHVGIAKDKPQDCMWTYYPTKENK